MTDTTTLIAVSKLSKDLRLAAATLTKNEARFLVDAYYQMQGDRIRDFHQQRQLANAGEPASVLTYLGEQHESLEKEIAKALDVYSAAQPIGEWARSIVGIGPVIAAGLIAHIDIERCDTASKLWSFAGLNPTVKWERGQKRPWNASLKTLCWKIGESFIKTQSNANSVYGPMYVERKAYETARNERGDNAETAARILSEKKFRGDTVAKKALESGKLPQAQIHARARRYAVKMFLAHFHETWRKLEGLPVREPYIVAKDAIHGKIDPPRGVVFEDRREMTR